MAENEDQDNQSDSTDTEQVEESEPVPRHSCGAELKKGMKYCPACGDRVNTEEYR